MNRPIRFGFLNGRALGILLQGVLLVTSPAWASLGDNVTSIETDKTHMKGTLRSVATQRYVAHEIQVSTGQLVREFVSREGIVFGVAWDGPFQPDLQQILGVYFEPIKKVAAAQRRHGHGPISVETPNVVFHQGGHARNFHGSAYVPAMVPTDVEVSEIR